MKIDRFNLLPVADAVAELLACCGCRRWAEAVASQRPFSTFHALLEAAGGIWFALPETDWLEAFGRHPRIGERAQATSAYLAHSNNEQAAAKETLDAVAQDLVAGNLGYETRFGFRYIVFANGRSAPELLAVLEERLRHTREEELREAAREQHRITMLRMAKWLEETAP